MSFIAVLLTAFVVLDLLWWLVARRDLRRPALRWLAAGWLGLMLGGFVLFLSSRFLGARVEEVIPRPVVSAIFIWHLCILPLWLGWSLLRGFLLAGRRLVAGAGESSDRAARHRHPPEAWSRREFLATGAKFAPVVLTGGASLASEWQLEDFRIRRLEVPLPTLPPALDGLTIAHLSDVHVGRFTRGAVLERIVTATNELEADFAVMTGDLINHSLHDLPAGIDLLRGVRARHGVFLCEGNHDLFADAAAFRRDVRRAGLQFLREDTATVEARPGAHVQLFGLQWSHGDAEHRAALADLARARRADAFPILLAHHPHVFDFAEDYALTFAGHTHGGQLMLNERVGFGPWLFRYWSGLYRHENRALVVSNGVGNWFPIRIAAPAEITHVALRRA